MEVEVVPILLSERLRLRPVNESDLPIIYLLKNEEEVLKYQYVSPKTLDECHEFMIRYRSIDLNEPSYLWAVELDGTMIGSICLWNFTEDFKAELGVEILPEYFRLGYMSESAQVVLEYAFAVVGLSEVWAYTHPDNYPARNFLGKLKFDEISTSGSEIILVRTSVSN